MRIVNAPLRTNRNNIAFGYDRKLNAQLKKRLSATPETVITKAIGDINKQCNDIEDTIYFLENETDDGIDKNENVISFLLDYFLEAKLFLCGSIDRFFPELNFSKTTLDYLDEEQQQFAENKDIDEIQEQVEKGIAYNWREYLLSELSEAIDESLPIIGTPEIEYETTGVVSEKKAISKVQDEVKLLEKFKPTDDSPKSLDDVVGLENCVEDIKDLIILPLENPSEAKLREEEYGIKTPGFTLFFGPPGCGKTMLAQAIAIQSGCDMYALDLSKVSSPYVNESSIKIRQAFDEIEQEAKKSSKPVFCFYG